ncbi:hypothetical protein F5Y16DRAFT_190095 [Xylariaceae sp. FL0255]|nr:hypothetical protein F5Y16DRAFT_190095 [Xylariaceae sp. FL0255]
MRGADCTTSLILLLPLCIPPSYLMNVWNVIRLFTSNERQPYTALLHPHPPNLIALRTESHAVGLVIRQEPFQLISLITLATPHYYSITLLSRYPRHDTMRYRSTFSVIHEIPRETETWAVLQSVLRLPIVARSFPAERPLGITGDYDA